MTDSIERDVIVRAPVGRVWRVLTDPSYVAQWFGQQAEFELRPGAPARFGWDEYGWFSARIERVEPPGLFSFRWAEDPGVPLETSPSTLVEFTLSSTTDGHTRVQVVESGFADFPTERQQAAVADHVEGWRLELDDLIALAERLYGAVRP